jgi:hypothetical protein
MRALRFLVAVSTLLSLSAEGATCLHYGGEPVTLSGTLRYRTFFGPPNYGENPTTDSRETQSILYLSAPICVDADPSGDEEAESKQLRVTLVPMRSIDLKRYVGKMVRVRGTLFHSITGHHHTPVLMTIQSSSDVSVE